MTVAVDTSPRTTPAPVVAQGARAFARRVFIIKVLTIVAFIALWEGIARSGFFYAGVVPSVLEVAKAVVAEVQDRSFYRDLGITLLESSVGFIFGSLIAITIAIWLGTSPYTRRVLEPYITAIGGTPKIIFLPILFLIFGLGLESKMAKAAMSTFFPVVLSATSGFLQIPPVLLRVGKSFYLSRWQLVQKIYLPAMANPLLTGLRLGMAMAIIGVLSAEITYSDGGLGFRLIRYADQFKIAYVYAVTILIFALSASVNFAATKLQDRMNRHQRRKVNTTATLASGLGSRA